MLVPEEEENKKLYKEYGIAEWREKSFVLNEDELLQVKDDLKNNRHTKLTEMLKLPFPDFMAHYLEKYPLIEGYGCNLEFWYKLYILNTIYLKVFVEAIKNPDITYSEVASKYGIQYSSLKVKNILCQDLDKFLFSRAATEKKLRSIYVYQYVLDDIGYKERLSYLNPLVQDIVTDRIGLYGHDIHSVEFIATKYEINVNLVRNLLDFILPTLLLPIDAYKRNIGYVECQTDYDYITYPQNDFFDFINKKLIDKNSLKTPTKIIKSRTISEEEAVLMYEQYEITEWQEKYIVLSEDERASVTEQLKNGETTELTNLIRLPFPFFANEYFKDSKQKVDTTFGFRLYFFKPNILEIIVYRIKDPDLTFKEIQTKLGYSTALLAKDHEIMTMPFDQLFLSNDSISPEIGKKALYLTQYIDTKTSEELGLPIAETFKLDNTEKGYDFNSKLALLNPIGRYIIEQYLGLHGYDFKPLKDIPQKLSLPKNGTLNFINFIIPLFMRPYGEFKHKIGYHETDAIQSYHDYRFNHTYRDIDFRLESYCYLKRQDEATKEILGKLTKKQLYIYVLKKLYNWDDEQICRNLITTPREIQRQEESIEQAFSGSSI